WRAGKSFGARHFSRTSKRGNANVLRLRIKPLHHHDGAGGKALPLEELMSAMIADAAFKEESRAPQHFGLVRYPIDDGLAEAALATRLLHGNILENGIRDRGIAEERDQSEADKLTFA